VAAAGRDQARVDDEPAFVLHSYPYSETSLLIDVYTAHYGRLPLLARGARRPRAALRGVLQAFQPLVIGWSGRGEVRTLQRAEWMGGLPRPAGRALWCGFYLNELLMRLLPRDDPHEALFADYAQALSRVCLGAEPEPVLRLFEKRLLSSLGYGLVLDVEADTRQPVDAETPYTYEPDRGPVRAREAGAVQGVFSGAALRAIAAEQFEDRAVLAQAKHLMRQVIAHRLDQKPLRVTQVWRDLLEL
jgi:DNA repair protein RecO (recombination protein O)